ncbi:hypothetical protein ABF87_08405 [Nitrosomonas sp. JL21]|uniref:hypothetical protein n=1 Tax=Nitrosomonas sp. JL21 TaxID=153949 RepID=UPI00136EDB41|nr:hypothetical protein [Nitrosomonas sp. JL21]MBL8498852.1 hypothetical protein [Nitrosomonas sp.]MXS77980.1 hypothetical protein [Nitrosomonas sp. JL21]
MIRRALWWLVLLGILAVLSACASKAQQKKSPDASDRAKAATPFEQLSLKTTARTSFEDNGRFILMEGTKCVQRDSGAEAATVVAWIEMPHYVDNGSIVLNGWDLRYLHQEREVNSMRADITHSKLVKNAGSAMLMFEIQGKLDDQNGKEPFEFCVFYTAFGYSSIWFDAAMESDYNGIEAAVQQKKNQGAVTTLENTGNKGTLKRHDAIAIIPRGFEFRYDDAFECEFRLSPCKWGDRVDYPLLQMAYSLSQTGVSPSQDGSPHWATQTIFKDNGTRTHGVKTRAAVIRGSSIKVRPDFLVLNPRSANAGNCRKNSDGAVRTQTFRIDELPYNYAVPLLTGWDLSYECGQQRVQRAGIWVHDVRFDPVSQSMEYKVSSILRDQDGAPSFNATHRVTVLGFNRLSSTAPYPTPEINIKIRQH